MFHWLCQFTLVWWPLTSRPLTPYDGDHVPCVVSDSMAADSVVAFRVATER